MFTSYKVQKVIIDILVQLMIYGNVSINTMKENQLGQNLGALGN